MKQFVWAVAQVTLALVLTLLPAAAESQDSPRTNARRTTHARHSSQLPGQHNPALYCRLRARDGLQPASRYFYENSRSRHRYPATSWAGSRCPSAAQPAIRRCSRSGKPSSDSRRSPPRCIQHYVRVSGNYSGLVGFTTGANAAYVADPLPFTVVVHNSGTATIWRSQSDPLDGGPLGSPCEFGESPTPLT